MRGIGYIGSSPSTQNMVPVSSASALSGASPGAYQKASATGPAGSLAGRGTTGLASPSLSSQTTSTLMQEQDITQAQGHGGGGGHGGGMKMTRNLEAESAAAAEEMQPKRKRKKLAGLKGLPDKLETSGLDEEDEDDPENSGSLKTGKSDKDDKGVWGWL